MRMRAVFLVSIVVLAGAGATWAAVSDVVADFTVVTNLTPPGAMEPQGKASCNYDPPLPADGDRSAYTGTQSCEVATGWSGTVSENASVTSTSHGQGGFVGSCDIQLVGEQYFSFTWTNGTRTPVNNTPQDRPAETDTCGSTFSFPDGSTLSGSGQSHIGPGTCYCASGQISGGTGAWAGQTGTLSLSIPAHDERAPAILLDKGSQQWVAHLHKGAPRTLIAYPAPGAKVTSSADAGLYVESSPNLACTGTAKSGGKTVALGTKRTPARAGGVLLLPKLTTALTAGRWSVAVTCGTTKTATASYTIVR